MTEARIDSENTQAEDHNTWLQLYPLFETELASRHLPGARIRRALLVLSNVEYNKPLRDLGRLAVLGFMGGNVKHYRATIGIVAVTHDELCIIEIGKTDGLGLILQTTDVSKAERQNVAQVSRAPLSDIEVSLAPQSRYDAKNTITVDGALKATLLIPSVDIPIASAVSERSPEEAPADALIAAIRGAAADSDEGDHPVRRKASTQSDRSRSPDPSDGDHSGRSVATLVEITSPMLAPSSSSIASSSWIPLSV